MLSMKQLDRNWRSGAYEPLTRDLALNGLPVPMSLRVRLSERPAAATGLALRRAAELIYGSTALTRDMTDALLDTQSPDGSWGGDPLTTACVLAGLEALDPDHDLGRPNDHTRRTVAIERGFAALATQQADDGLFAGRDDRSFADRLLAGAFVQYLLHRSQRFCGAVRWFELCAALEGAESRGDRSLDRDGRALLSMSNQLAARPTATPAKQNRAELLGSAA